MHPSRATLSTTWSRTVAPRVALIWIAFITILFVLPPNDLTGYIFGGTFAALLFFYVLRVHGRFRGPVPQATSREALLKMEAELEKEV